MILLYLCASPPPQIVKPCASCGKTSLINVFCVLHRMVDHLLVKTKQNKTNLGRYVHYFSPFAFEYSNLWPWYQGRDWWYDFCPSRWVFFFFHFVVGRCSLRLDTEEWKMSFEITFLPLMVIASSHVITSYIFQKVQSTASKTPLAITSHSLFQQALSLSHCFFLYTSLPSPSCPPQDSFTPCLLLWCKC